VRRTELRERAATTCVFTPRDDVNTPHESTRLLGRGGRAAQFGCSRSSLVTRCNSAQVVLLCGECGLRYGGGQHLRSSLLPSIFLSFRRISRAFHPPVFFLPFFVCHCFRTPFRSQPWFSFIFCYYFLSPLTLSSILLHPSVPGLTD
jgi:hypothetical protein